MIRDWSDSEKIESISFQAEVLLVRLIMKADDFGSYYGNPKLIKSFCFPLRDSIREADISRWLHELASAGLIVFYAAENKRLLNIINFGQRKRSMKKAFPLFDVNSPQLAATRRNSRSELEVEEEKEIEGEIEENEPPNEKKFLVPQMQKLWTENFPNYTTDKKLDYEALGTIMGFMFSQSGNHDPTDNNTQEMALNTLQAIADEVKKDPFWLNKPLKSIANNIQEFYNKIKNPQNACRGKKDRPTADSLQQALNRRFQEQAGSGEPAGTDAYKRTG